MARVKTLLGVRGRFALMGSASILGSIWIIVVPGIYSTKQLLPNIPVPESMIYDVPIHELVESHYKTTTGRSHVDVF